MGDRRHGGVASPPRANATIEVSRSDVEVETPLDFRSFVRASVDRATRSLARREPTRHLVHPSPLIHLFIHPSLIHPSLHPSHSCIRRAHGRGCPRRGHRRVMIGDSSKPYVSRMTTVVDVRNSDGIDVLDVIDRFHHTIDRSFSSITSIVFIASHRSHRIASIASIIGFLPPPPRRSSSRLVVVVAPCRVVAFVRDARESAARVRSSNRRARKETVVRRAHRSFVPLSSRLASSRRVFTARVSPRRDVDDDGARARDGRGRGGGEDDADAAGGLASEEPVETIILRAGQPADRGGDGATVGTDGPVSPGRVGQSEGACATKEEAVTAVEHERGLCICVIIALCVIIARVDVATRA